LTTYHNEISCIINNNSVTHSLLYHLCLLKIITIMMILSRTDSNLFLKRVSEHAKAILYYTTYTLVPDAAI
jgi:hypothetical protein